MESSLNNTLSSAMYREQILDLFKNPMHFGKLDDKLKTNEGHKHNPSCGDEFTVQLVVDKNQNNKIVDAKFFGSGCAISTASASLFTDAIIGKSIDEAKKMTSEDVIKLLGIPVSASRITCVTLCMDCFHIAIDYNAIGDVK